MVSAAVGDRREHERKRRMVEGERLMIYDAQAIIGDLKGVTNGMATNQKQWSMARRELASAVTSLGYPEDFADLLAKQLGSPRSMERMTGYLLHARPQSVEMIVDEMLAICADAETWRRKKEGQEAQAGISAWLSSAERLERQYEDDDDGEEEYEPTYRDGSSINECWDYER